MHKKTIPDARRGAQGASAARSQIDGLLTVVDRRSYRARVSRSSRALIERKDGRVLRRMTIYLPPETAQWLREFCAEHDLEISDATTSAILLMRRTLDAASG
jgi:hypothetical protein